MLLKFAPWIALGTLLALIASYWAGNHQGHKAERLAWEAVQSKAIAENIQKAREAEAAHTARNAEIEGMYLHEKSKADDLAGKLAAASRRGLRDPQGRCEQRMPPTGPAPSSAPEPAPGGCILSEGTSADLRNLAKRADDILAIARAGQSYAGVK